MIDLIYEWSWEAVDGEIDSEFVTAFHGPEIHTWGKGPRIWHYKAGVYLNGNLEKCTHILELVKKRASLALADRFRDMLFGLFGTMVQIKFKI